MKETGELEYLRWCWSHADFGPAESDVRRDLDLSFVWENGMRPPKNWDTLSEENEEFWDERYEGYFFEDGEWVEKEINNAG